MKNNLFYAALATMMLAACSNEEVIDTTLATPVELQVSAGVNSETRTNGETWEDGDKIGIAVTNGNDAPTMAGYTNQKYKISQGAGATSAKFVPDTDEQKILFSSKSESVNFAAYSPYSDDVSNGAIALSAINGAVTDYLWASAIGKTYSSNGANFAFSHKMAKLIITFTYSADEFSGESISDVTVSDMYSSASFNIADGSVTSQGSTVIAKLENTSTKEYSAVLIPYATVDTPVSHTVYVKFGDDKVYQTTIKPALEQGKSYSYSIKVSKTGLTVDGSTITTWISVDTETPGDATMKE